MSSYVGIVTDQSFKALVLKPTIPVLVDFWAPWCGPCKALSSVMEELAEEYQGKIFVVKLNIDENTSTPVKYCVKSVPTIILFKDGQIIDIIVGVVSKYKFSSMIDSGI